jgi:hypothetical protein
MRRSIRERGSAHESQTWWRGCFGEGYFCELPLYGVLRSSLPASNAQATAKIAHLGDVKIAHLGEVPARTRLLGCLLV